MNQPKHIIALDIPLPVESELPEGLQKFFGVCRDKLCLIPNVLAAYSHDDEQLRTFSRFYNALMFGKSGLSSLEKEMIAVVMSSANYCFSCLAAHSCNVREYSKNPILGELMVMRYRVAELGDRHRRMLDVADKLPHSHDKIDEADRQTLRDSGFVDRDIWDIANIAGFYNMTNRVAGAVDIQPNTEYHGMHR